MEKESPTVLNVTTTSRPKRVAFLINPQPSNDSEIDQIIRYSTGVWGGRFYLIIPTDGEIVSGDWWTLLMTVDPDVIYSLLPLSDSLIQKINKYILPVKIIEITPEERARHDRQHYLINTSDIRSLESLEIVPYHLANPRFGREPYFYYIKEESWESSPLKTFVLRNFGTLPNVLGVSETFKNVPYEILQADQLKAPSEILQRSISSKGRNVFPIDLSHLYVSRSYYLGWHDFTRGFHLVVGSSIFDAIYAWNRASVSELFNGRDTLWIPAEFLQDADLMKLLGAFIDREFWGHNNDQCGRVVSYSIDEQSLGKIAKELSEAVHFYFQPIRLAADRFPIPEANLHPRREDRYTEQVPLMQEQGLAGFPRPPFLMKGHPQQEWMVDVEIRHTPGDHSQSIGNPDWNLPKRLGLAGLFLGDSQGSRIINGGLPSATIQVESKTINVRLPSNENVLFTCLDFHRQHTNTGGKHQRPPSKFSHMVISDKGRYLRGMLTLFGGLSSAGNFFEDPFWRAMTFKMAGHPENDSGKRSKQIKQVFDELFASDPSPVESGSARLNQLIEKLATKSTPSDPDPVLMSRDQLVSAFGDLRGKALQNDPNNSWWKAQGKFNDWQNETLESLVSGKILFQGSEIRCPYCFTSQWHIVDDLSSRIRCDGCLSEFDLPLNPEWSFRLNDLVRNALKRHGTLAVLHALYDEMQQASRGTFLFVPCHDIFKKGSEEPLTDIDILVISRSAVVIGEVKTSPQGYRPEHFETLKELALDLLPDEVLVAAEGTGWPNEVAIEIQKLTTALAPMDIKVRARLLSWRA